MTIRELIKELLEYDLDRDVEILVGVTSVEVTKLDSYALNPSEIFLVPSETLVKQSDL